MRGRALLSVVVVIALSAVAVVAGEALAGPGEPVGSLIGSGSSGATSGTVVVPATVVFEHGNRPGKPGNCSAVVFVKWAHVPGTTAATVNYRWKGKDYSAAGPAPFSDRYEWVATYRVPAGYHWLKVSAGWKDGPTPNDCSSYLPYFKSVYSLAATAELTVVRSPKCAEAVREQAKRSKAVNRLLKEHGLASTAGSQKLEALASEDPEFAAALQQRTLWSGRVKKYCS